MPNPEPNPNSGPPPVPPTDHWSSIRLWQIQWVRDLLLIVGIVGIFWLGYTLRVVTVPMLLALLLAYLLEPVISRLTRAQWISRPGAAFGLILAAVLLVVVPVVIGAGFAIVQGVSVATTLARNSSDLVSSVHGESEQTRELAFHRLPSQGWQSLSTYLREAKADASHELEAPAGVKPTDDKVAPTSTTPTPTPAQPSEQPTADDQTQPAEDTEPIKPAPRPRRSSKSAALINLAVAWTQDNAGAIARSVGQQAIGGSAQAFSLAAGTLGRVGFLAFSGFLTAFFFFYFSTSYASVVRFFDGLIPPDRRHRTLELIHKMDGVIAGFVRGRLTICVILAGFMTSAYWLIGVPTSLILGPLVGLLFLVPFVHGLGAPVAMLLMWLQPEGLPFNAAWWWIVGAPLGVYLIAQLLDDYVLTPSIQGKATNLDSPTILFASIAGGALAGVYGLLVAIPVAACLKILMVEVYWPRVKAWTRGQADDPLPLGRHP